jgi:RimJ/RimL family protein N-acetyltransferase
MNQFAKIEGEFVNLRPLKPTDAAITYLWRQAQRARMLNVGASSVEHQTAWISARPISEYNFLIELKNGQEIGMLSLVGVDLHNLHAETGRFLIGDEDAAKGIPAAVEAMKLIYELAFDKLGLVRVHGTVADGNRLMIKWQKYLGMKEEGRLRNHYFIDGNWQDAICLGLLAEEYRKCSIPRMNALISASRRSA